MKLTPQEEEARKHVCMPLDNIPHLRTRDEGRNEVSIESRVKELSPYVGLFKYGHESFTRFGTDGLKVIQDNGANVFLDFKFHDIPKTLRGAADAAAQKALWMFNVHASGGREMMEWTAESVNHAAGKYGIQQPHVVGVTVLTSIGPAQYLDINRSLVPKLASSELKEFYGMRTDDKIQQEKFAEMLISKSYKHLTTEGRRGLRCNVVEQQVKNLAIMSYESGLDGIVCSAADLYAVREFLPEGFMYVTPGIKGPKTLAGSDQKRVFTPGNAYQDGSSILVIGRAITDPRTAEQKEQNTILAPEMRTQAAYEVLQDIAVYI